MGSTDEKVASAAAVAARILAARTASRAKDGTEKSDNKGSNKVNNKVNFGLSGLLAHGESVVERHGSKAPQTWKYVQPPDAPGYDFAMQAKQAPSVVNEPFRMLVFDTQADGDEELANISVGKLSYTIFGRDPDLETTPPAGEAGGTANSDVNVDIAIPHASVDSIHAFIQLRNRPLYTKTAAPSTSKEAHMETAAYIMDMDTDAGTFVQPAAGSDAGPRARRRLTPLKYYRLRHMDVVSFGKQQWDWVFLDENLV